MMKKSRFFSLFLVLVLVLTVLPLSALAATEKLGDYDTGHHSRYDHENGYYGYDYHTYVFTGAQSGTVDIVGNIVTNATGDFVQYIGKTVTVGTGGKDFYYTRHLHNYAFRSTRSGHGMACWCGAWQIMFEHDDPLTAKDGRCSCGYKFFDNAQITVIWMKNVALTPRFYKDKYEYTGKLLVEDMDEIPTVTVKLFDELATLEQPENFKLKPGTNTFEFTVTAENQKATKTYTITIEK